MNVFLRRLKLRFAIWASIQAGRVCAWAYEVENAMDDREPCPDCLAKECYCGQKADDREQYDSIYQSGFEAGQRDMYR